MGLFGRACALFVVACLTVVGVVVLTAMAGDMLRLRAGVLAWVGFGAGVGALIGVAGIAFGVIASD